MNVIPERATVHIGFRAPTDTELKQIEAKVVKIFNSTAVATGCTVI